MELIGLGIDLTEISRIHKIMNSNIKDRFLLKYFSDTELKLFESKKNSYQTIAANFAAKEAFSKSIGTGFNNIKLSEISILRNELDKPFIKLQGKCSEKYKNLKFEVSLTHTDTTAGAVVIAYKE